MAELPPTAHLLQCRVLVNLSGGHLRQYLGRRNTNSDAILQLLFSLTHEDEAPFDRDIGKIIGYDAVKIGRARVAVLGDKQDFWSPYKQGTIRHDPLVREEMYEVARLDFDIDIPVKSGQIFRVCFGTLEDKYTKYQQRRIKNDEEYLNYANWRSLLKQERVVMATKHNMWMCPTCLLAESEDPKEREAYRKHINVWHSQRAFVDTLKAIIR